MSSTWLNLLHPTEEAAHEYFNRSLLIAQWTVFPTAWSHIHAGAHAWSQASIRTLAHARTCKTTFPLTAVVLLHRYTCLHTDITRTHTHTHCNLMTLDANELLWCLPDTHGGCRMGASLPVFNDVYLAHVWGVNEGDEGRACVCVCVTDWQMFKMKGGTHPADISGR